MVRIHSQSNRGVTRLDWLESFHSFSFGEYYDPERMGFHSLRVINEDRVLPRRGFDTHPHRDMEIVTFVIDGVLEHRDSLGTVQEIKAGEVQRMTAGQGVLHSEWNPSSSQPVHFLQIWILPAEKGLKPEYEKIRRNRVPEEREWQRLLSGTQMDGALKIHQDVEILGGRPQSGSPLSYAFSPGRAGWIQVVAGKAALADRRQIQAGDGVEIENEREILLTALEPKTEFLLFDLR